MPDLDLEIRGPRSSRPLEKGRPSLQKNFFRPVGPQFGLKIRGEGGGRVPWAPPLDPPLDFVVFSLFFRHGNETRLNQIDDKPFTSHPPHETDHTTGVYALVFSKRCGLFYVLSDSYPHKWRALETR